MPQVLMPKKETHANHATGATRAAGGPKAGPVARTPRMHGSDPVPGTTPAAPGVPAAPPAKPAAPPAAPAPARRTSGPYELIRRAAHPEYAGTEKIREVMVRGIPVGGTRPIVIAGPCAVESLEQTLALARACRDAGADMLRGGAFKPRTSPYDFQGLGRAGLEILAAARDETGLAVVTEALDPRHVDLVAQFADVIQIGARNMQNFPLLTEVGRAGKPVLLKRHWAATLTEWLSAAEYIAVEGNLDVILCERGIRTFSQGTYNRSTLDLNVIAAVRRETFLPIVVDPSHGTGVAALVPGASIAGIASGAHGLIIEVLAEETNPDDVLSDGYQSIRPSVLKRIIEDARRWSRT